MTIGNRTLVRQDGRGPTDLRPVTLTKGSVLYEAGESITQVYFPETAMVSYLSGTSEGETIETVGGAVSGPPLPPVPVRPNASAARWVAQMPWSSK